MESQEDYYYDKKPSNKGNCSCFNLAIYFLTILLIFTIGLIIEFVFGFVALITLPIAIIVAILIGIMLLLTILFSLCSCCFKRRTFC
ncbi:hypothetical protein D3C72_1811290 [compost metagenome]